MRAAKTARRGRTKRDGRGGGSTLLVRKFGDAVNSGQAMRSALISTSGSQVLSNGPEVSTSLKRQLDARAHVVREHKHGTNPHRVTSSTLHTRVRKLKRFSKDNPSCSIAEQQLTRRND